MRGLGVQMSMARTLLLFLPKQRPFIYTAIFEWDAYFPIISFHWFFVTHNIIRTNCQRYQFLSLFNPSKLPSHPSGCVRVAGSGPRYKYAAPHFVYLNHYRMLSSQHRNTGLPFELAGRQMPSNMTRIRWVLFVFPIRQLMLKFELGSSCLKSRVVSIYTMIRLKGMSEWKVATCIINETPSALANLMGSLMTDRFLERPEN